MPLTIQKVKEAVEQAGGIWVGVQEPLLPDEQWKVMFLRPNFADVLSVPFGTTDAAWEPLVNNIRAILQPESRPKNCSCTPGHLCSVCYHRQYYQANKEKWPQYDASWFIQLQRRLRKFKISASQYLTLLWNQDGRCPCGRELERARIDHDHKCCPGRTSCGKCVRGLLCNRCNLLLGLVENEPEMIPAPLANYLATTEQRKRSIVL